MNEDNVFEGALKLRFPSSIGQQDALRDTAAAGRVARSALDLQTEQALDSLLHEHSVAEARMLQTFYHFHVCIYFIII